MLRGKKIYLRALNHRDLEKVRNWINDLEIAIPMDIKTPINKIKQAAWYRKLKKDPSKRVFAIIEKETNRHIGNISLNEINYHHRKASLSIFIGEKDYQSKGFGYDALKTFLDYSFNVLKLHRIYLRVNKDNKRAINLYRKCGFVKEGLLRHDIIINNKYIDRWQMSLLHIDFKNAFEIEKKYVQK